MKVKMSLVLCALFVAATSAPAQSALDFHSVRSITLATSGPTSLANPNIHGVLALDGSWYVATDAGLSWTKDKGKTWTSIGREKGLPEDMVGCLTSQGGALLVGARGFASSSDLGATWSQTVTRTYSGGNYRGPDNVVSLAVDKEKIYAVHSAAVMVSGDAGATWEDLALPDQTENGVNYLCAAADGDLVLVGTTQGVLISRDGGNAFETLKGMPADRAGQPTEVDSIVIQGSTIYAAGYPPLSRSRDKGRTWEKVPIKIGTTVSNWAVPTLVADGKRLAAGGGYGLLISADQGVTWTRASTAQGLPSNTITSIWMKDNLFLVGTGRGLGISEDGGKTWRSFSPSTGLLTNWARKIVAAGPVVIALTPQTGVALSRDGGSTWTALVSQGGLDFYDSADCAISADTIALASDGVLLSHDGGKTWKRYAKELVGSNIYTSVLIDGAAIYAASPDGIAVSANGGAAWTWVAKDKKLNGRWPTSLAKVGKEIWIGTDKGSFLVSQDSMATVKEIAVAPGQQTVPGFVLYKAGDTLLASTDWPGIFTSSDGGKSWQHAAFDKGNASIVGEWHGVLFMRDFRDLKASTDGGATWTAITEGLDTDFRGQIATPISIAGSGDTAWLATSAGIVQYAWGE
jgi:photosystem II stability/assembly factor-like uncharacterized protein